MTTDSIIKPDNLFPEAPASWNTRYVTPEGFTCQITLRGETGKDLLEKANLALGYLIDKGFKPDAYNSRSSGSGETKRCEIHQCDMRKHEKDGKSWFSHKTDDGWCYGKVRKNGGNNG